MKKNLFTCWMQNIYATQADEISCSECFELVSRYVEHELSGEDPQLILPQVKQHLIQCSACREEYETLHDLRNLEEQGKAPSIGELRDSIQ